jgi:RimJ/RimL family protein N-acetyltransferase
MIKLNKIGLRAVEESDAVYYFKWINDPETNFYRGLYPPTSEIVAKNWIAEQLNQAAEKLTLAIDLYGDEALIGTIGFVGLRGICSRSRRAEMWIYVGDKFQWGNGYGKDSISAICQYAFSEMKLHRLWLECDPEHIAGVTCYQKIGFVHEGTQRDGYFRRGKFRNTITMGLLKPDWEKASAQT